MTRLIEGDLVASTAGITIVVARFNELIVDSLLNGALTTLKRQGVQDKHITVVKLAAEQSDCAAVITLGAVIRGGTPHFDYVAGQAASGVTAVALKTGKPVVFGVLTTDTIEQAIERAGTKAGNKGADAAMTALEMINLIRKMA